MPRISKENYYLDIAETVLERATCLRRVYGAIIVKNDEIISTGYNGAPPRTEKTASTSASAHARSCRSRAASATSFAAASTLRRTPSSRPSRRDMVGGTIYLMAATRTGELLHDATSCAMCRRQIINAGLEKVVIRRTETEFEVVPVRQWIDEDDSLPKHKKRRSLFKRRFFFCSAFSGSISRCRRSGALMMIFTASSRPSTSLTTVSLPSRLL